MSFGVAGGAPPYSLSRATARYGGRGAWGIALVGGMVGFSVGIVAFWS
jgi:hypothetical protein